MNERYNYDDIHKLASRIFNSDAVINVQSFITVVNVATILVN